MVALISCCSPDWPRLGPPSSADGPGAEGTEVHPQEPVRRPACLAGALGHFNPGAPWLPL